MVPTRLQHHSFAHHVHSIRAQVHLKADLQGDHLVVMAGQLLQLEGSLNQVVEVQGKVDVGTGHQ